MKKLFINFLSFVFLGGALWAAGPVMTYQGRLKEANAPVTGNRNLLFELCNDETAGACTSSPDNTQSFAVANGLFKSTFTVPAVDFSAGSWYLQVSVGGSALSPREKLTFVPYSVYASTAGYAAGAVAKTGDTMTGPLTLTSSVTVNDASGLGAARVLLADNVSISSESLSAFGGGVRISSNVYIVGFSSAAKYYGDGSALTGVTASGAVQKAGDIMTGTLTLTGADSYVTGQSSITTAGSFFGDGSTLSGIIQSTATGTYPLSISGNAATATMVPPSGINLSTVTANHVLKAGDTMAGRLTAPDFTATYGIIASSALFSSGITASSFTATGTGLGAVQLRLADNVLISSEAIASLGGGVTISSNVYVMGFSSAAKYYGDGSALTGVTAPGAVLKAGDNMTGSLALLNDSTITVTGNAFSVGGSTLVVLNGNVGIGVTNPSAKLEVNGGISLVNALDIQGAGPLIQAPAGTLNFNAASGGNLVFKGNNADIMVMQNGGNVGISSATPSYRLVISSGAGESGTIMTVSTGTTDLFWVAGNGAHATKYYGDGSALTSVTAAGAVSKTGDTMTGWLNMSGSSVTITTDGALQYALYTNSLVISTYGAVQTIGGNSRGLGAVDLQTARGSVSQVAGGLYSSLSGGVNNTASGNFSAVGGGNTNNATGHYSTVQGGQSNQATGDQSAVSGGMNNLTTGVYAAVGGGYNNNAATDHSVVGGGWNNSATGLHSAVGGGGYNTASGLYSAIPGGSTNTANGAYSFAAGYMSSSTVQGAFTWSDSEGIVMENTVMDRTVFKNRGGFLVTGSTRTTMSAASDRGVLITGDGLVGISTGTPGAALDVVSTGTASTIYAQIWRNGSGDIVSSMTSQGVLYPQIAALGDNLGSHIATTTLEMKTFGINTSSAISAAFYQINGSTVLAALPGNSIGLGLNAGNVNTGGVNTFLGHYAGSANTTGSYNNLLGGLAGNSNTTGEYNNFLGYWAGYFNVSGSNNNFLGALAGRSNSIGSYNNIIGNNAGFGANGSHNNFMGYRAGYYNSTGYSNVVLGSEAGGYGSGAANPFSSSTLMGYQAGYKLATGSGDNVFLGYQAGYNVITGTGNILIGYSSGAYASSSGANNELNIGGLLYGDLSAKTIGISTRSPQAALDVVSTGTASTIYAQIWRNASGTAVATMTSEGNFSALSMQGDNLGNHIATTTLTANYGITSSTLTITGSEFMVGGSTFVVKNGRVGIGTGTPSALLEVRDNNATSAPYVLLVGTGTRASLVVTTGGVVGVGTFDPSTSTLFNVRANVIGSTPGEGYNTAIMGEIHAAGTDSNDGVVGGHFMASVDGDSPLKYLVGLYSRLERKSGSGNAWVDSAVGVYIDTPDNMSSGAGKITNTFGLYITTLTAGAQQNPPYAIYSEDPNARSYFAGSVGISTDNPQAALDVKSTGATAGYIQIWRNSGGTIVSSISAAGIMSASTFNAVGSAYMMNGVVVIDKDRNVFAKALSVEQPLVFSSLTITGSEFTVGGSTFVVRNGMVGIGTGTPQAALDVVSQPGASFALKVSTGGFNPILTVSSSGVAIGSLDYSTGAFLSVDAIAPNTVGTEEWTEGIRSSIHGIGTDASDVLVAGNFESELYSGSADGIAGLRTAVKVKAGSTVADVMGLMVEDFKILGTVAGDVYGIFIDTLTTVGQLKPSYAIYSADSQANTYLAGNTGIGVSSPIARLDVVQKDRLDTQEYIMRVSTDPNAYTLTVSTQNMVGVGTGSPWGTLHVMSGSESDYPGLLLDQRGNWEFLVNILRARGTKDNPMPVQADDGIGNISFLGYDGSVNQYAESAQITASVDGTPGAGSDMPGRLEFATAPDGTASPVTRMVIRSDGAVVISSDTIYPQAALDVKSTGPAAGYVQIWRDSTGLAVATMTSTGRLYAMVVSSAVNTAALTVSTGGVNPIFTVSTAGVTVGGLTFSTMSFFSVNAVAPNLLPGGQKEISIGTLGYMHGAGTDVDDILVAGNFETELNGGNAAYIAGLRTAVNVKSGTADRAVGLEVGEFKIDGTATNVYGIYISTLTKAGQPNPSYSIFSEDAQALSYFAGPVGIGGSPDKETMLMVISTSANSDTPMASVKIGSNNYPAGVTGIRARGTMESLAPVENGDRLFAIRMMGIVTGGEPGDGAAIESVVDGAVVGGTVPARIEFQTADIGVGLKSRMVIKSDGAVGISTGNPQAALDVMSTGTAAGYIQIWRDYNGNPVSSISAAGMMTASTFNAVGSAYMMNGQVVIDSNRNVFAKALSVEQPMALSSLTITGSEFTVGGSTFVVKNGLVGIGTGTPQATLDVVSQPGASFAFKVSTGGFNPILTVSSSGVAIGSLDYSTGALLSVSAVAPNLSGSEENAVGVQGFIAGKNTDSQDSIVGGNFESELYSGNANYVGGARVTARVDAGAAATNLVGLFVDSFDVGGSASNRYGIMIATLTSSAQMKPSYAIYSQDPQAVSYFAGPVGIGTDNVKGMLTVVSTDSDNDYPVEIAQIGSAQSNGIIALRAKGTPEVLASVSSGDKLFSIRTLGYDGSDYKDGATIESVVDQTPSGNGVPTRLEFLTTPDGTATPVTRMVIKNDGAVGISTGNPQAALDVKSTGPAAGYIQIWRDSTGAAVASMTVTGRLYSGGGDNLGDHIATTTLQMKGFGINTSSAVSAAHYQINGSTVLAVLLGDSLGVGVGAGKYHTGSRDTYVGYYTGYNAGDDNTFLGYNAGTTATGNSNTFVGSYAGQANNTAADNTFLGHRAGFTNTSGARNISVGSQAGYLTTTGSYNSILGYFAGYENTTGEYNSLLGSYAGYYNQAGSGNTIVGYKAGSWGSSTPSSFSSSTIMGYQAGYQLTTGNNNIFLGWQAGYNITTGTGNIVIGYDAGLPNPSDNYKLNIGGVIFGDLATGKIGVGTPVPQEKLDITNGNILLSNDYKLTWGAPPAPYITANDGSDLLAFGLLSGEKMKLTASSFTVSNANIVISTTTGDRGIVFQDGTTLNTAPLRTVVVVTTFTQTLSNDSTANPDPYLKFFVGPGERWTFEAVLYAWTNDSSGWTTGFRVGVSGPAAPTPCRWDFAYYTYDGTAVQAVGIRNNYADSIITWAATMATPTVIKINGVINNSSTGGFLNITWAQNIATAFTNYVEPGSYLIAHKMP